MGKSKSKGAKFTSVKKIIQKYKQDVLNPKKKNAEKEKLGRNVPQISSAQFFSYNMALGAPYQVIVDTNFVNFSIQNKLDFKKGMMDSLCKMYKQDVLNPKKKNVEKEKLGRNVPQISSALFFSYNMALGAC